MELYDLCSPHERGAQLGAAHHEGGPDREVRRPRRHGPWRRTTPHRLEVGRRQSRSCRTPRARRDRRTNAGSPAPLGHGEVDRHFDPGRKQGRPAMRPPRSRSLSGRRPRRADGLRPSGRRRRQARCPRPRTPPREEATPMRPAAPKTATFITRSPTRRTARPQRASSGRKRTSSATLRTSSAVTAAIRASSSSQVRTVPKSNNDEPMRDMREPESSSDKSRSARRWPLATSSSRAVIPSAASRSSSLWRSSSTSWAFSGEVPTETARVPASS